jgi:regulator of replication initiation timing
MTPEESKILKLEDKVADLKYQLEALQVKNGSLMSENHSLIKSLRAGNNGAYILYLQGALKRMESLHIDQNNTIEAYIKHFNKFRTVYESKQP